MWPAALGSLKNLSYDQQYKALIEVMKALGIDTKKVTHTWRVAGAQAMDAAGVEDGVTFQLEFVVLICLQPPSAKSFVPLHISLETVYRIVCSQSSTGNRMASNR